MRMLLLLAVSLAVVSCALPTPVDRIQSNHSMFSALSAKQQELVRQGKIAPGMPADGVFLAWGKPAQSFSGAKAGKEVERWDYAGTRTVFMNSLGMDRYGPYRFRYHNGYYHDPFYGPDVAYVPYRVASVWFVDGKVDSWERIRE